MVYRIVNGQKRLFADISKIQKINGKTGAGNGKEVTLYAGDIVISSSDNDTVEAVLVDLQGQVDEAGKVDTVNSLSPDAGKNITLYGSNIKQTSNISETVSAGIERLTTKSHINADDMILEWDDNDGILAHLSLEYSKSEGKLLLFGKNGTDGSPSVISEVPLSLDSQISHASTHEWTGSVWSPILPNDVTGLPVSPNIGPYLVLGFDLADGSTEYSFSDLTSLIKPIVAGNGIVITDGVEGSKVVSVKVAGESDYNLSVASNGVKYTTWEGTKAEFLGLVTPADGIYYVNDDAE